MRPYDQTSRAAQWTLGSGQSISQVWNGTLSSSGSTASVRNVSYNGTLAARIDHVRIPRRRQPVEPADQLHHPLT